jgi:hypothetical protein
MRAACEEEGDRHHPGAAKNPHRGDTQLIKEPFHAQPLVSARRAGRGDTDWWEGEINWRWAMLAHLVRGGGGKGRTPLGKKFFPQQYCVLWESLIARGTGAKRRQRLDHRALIRDQPAKV